jgi:uncharacterized protein (DUF1015 family)
MMALVNMDDPDLVVLPYHRIANAAGEFDSVSFFEALGEAFDVTEPPSGHPATELQSAPRTAFLVRTKDGTTRIATLREDVDPAVAIPGPGSDAWKTLDVVVLQQLVLGPLLGIDPGCAQALERLSFAKDAHAALAAADSHDVVFIMNATRMSQLRAVSLAGETMPQKSTYFHPKLPSGLVFRSLD